MRTKMAVDLSVARRQLGEALGDHSQTYWNNMKLWYKQKISKEDFDAQAKKCLGNDNLHFHNEFLLAILAKCQALGSTPAPHPKTPQKLPPKPQLIKKGKIKKQKKVLKANFEQRFTPSDPLQNAPQLSLKLSEDSEIGLCSYDMMLPDSATIYGRLFLGAWDAGLDNVADDTVNLMLHATEYLVKDILTVCCSMRSTFRLRDGHFRYAMGGTYPRMHLRNSTSPWPPGSERSLGCVNGAASSSSNSGRTLEQAEAEAAVTVATSDSRAVAKPPISLMDLRDALQVHRRVIPSHTVYSANIERTLANMCHPSHDELEQNQLHKLEARRRYERLKQQRSLRL